MKKSVFVLITVMLLTLLSGCAKTTTPDFADVKWSRSTEGDTEYIRFDKDGKFTYYCACGNPVNDSDLCEGYSYNANSKTVTLDYIEKTDDAVTKITVKSYSDDKLVLDFAGDIRTFTKGDKETDYSSLDYLGEKYVAVKYPSDIFNYTVELSDKATPVTVGEYSAVTLDGRLFAKEADAEAVNAFIADDSNYSWKIEVYNADTDTSRVITDYLPSADIYSMKDGGFSDTIDADNIKSYAILSKSCAPVSTSIELIWVNDAWYWRTNEFNKTVEGWPEYIKIVPDSLATFIGKP